MQISALRDNPERKPARWRALVTFGLVLAAVAVSVWYFSPAGQQGRHLREARRHIDGVLLPIVQADARFAAVELTTFTGEGGAITVAGEVATWDDARALRDAISATKPRCVVYWPALFVRESLEREAPDPSLTERVTKPAK
ncbi:MAG TPA: hypothetical protein VHN77_10495 [Phycisphaerales bacterium]|nr:hypothetical protein [Phycisphaerales bacterium]